VRDDTAGLLASNMFSAECLSLDGTQFGLQSRLCGETYLGEKDTESNSTLLCGYKEEEAILGGGGCGGDAVVGAGSTRGQGTRGRA
jgi:hypothetical protein